MSARIDNLIKQAEDAGLVDVASELEDQEDRIKELEDRISDVEESAFKEGYDEGAIIDPVALAELFHRLDTTATISNNEFVAEVRKLYQG
jgi:hypothetical protein